MGKQGSAVGQRAAQCGVESVRLHAAPVNQRERVQGQPAVHIELPLVLQPIEIQRQRFAADQLTLAAIQQVQGAERQGIVALQQAGVGQFRCGKPQYFCRQLAAVLGLCGADIRRALAQHLPLVIQLAAQSGVKIVLRLQGAAVVHIVGGCSNGAALHLSLVIQRAAIKR